MFCGILSQLEIIILKIIAVVDLLLYTYVAFLCMF
jgi:hypothetical protein